MAAAKAMAEDEVEKESRIISGKIGTIRKVAKARKVRRAKEKETNRGGGTRKRISRIGKRTKKQRAEDASLYAALESRWEGAGSKFLYSPQGWKLFLAGCTSLRATGVSLSWLVLRGGFYIGSDPSVQGFFNSIIKNLTVKTIPSLVKMTSGAFPIREGRLHRVRQALSERDWKSITLKEFVEKWAEDSWTYLCLVGCNCLSGSSAALRLGRWTRLERLAVATIRASVQRRLAASVRREPLPQLKVHGG